MEGSSSSIPDFRRSFNDTPPNFSPMTPATEHGIGSWSPNSSSTILFPSTNQPSLTTQLHNPSLGGRLQQAGHNSWLGNPDFSSNLQYSQPAHGWRATSNGSPLPRRSTQLLSLRRPQRVAVSNHPNDFPHQPSHIPEQVNTRLSNSQSTSVPARLGLAVPAYGYTVPERYTEADSRRTQNRPDSTYFLPEWLQGEMVAQTPPSPQIAEHLPQPQPRHSGYISFIRSPPGLPPRPVYVPSAAAISALRRPMGRFRPMTALGEPRHIPMRRSEVIDPSAFSGNYRGEHNSRNASVANLPDELNCALWLTNLPHDVTHRELLACIRGIGRIWCTVINVPDYPRHITAAAKVVFFTPQAARQLLYRSLETGFIIRDRTIKVTHNRVKYGEESLASHACRVLIITGTSDFVNQDSLTAFFKERFVFEVDDIQCLIKMGHRSVIEYSFGSYRCQAQMGKMALEKDSPVGLEKVEFGEDPCEVGESTAAYKVAARRIMRHED